MSFQRFFKIGLFLPIFLILYSIFETPVFAHVVVKPAEVGISTYQTFSVGVPNEKDIPVTGVRLSIPAGVENVSPNVKPGWTIQTEMTSSNDQTHDIGSSHNESHPSIDEISWTGGSIPAGQRDEFFFSAKTPATPTTLKWKAYQTYADGTIVAWELSPNDPEVEGKGPLSQTKIVNDLSDASAPQASPNASNNALIFSLVAVSLSALSLSLQLRKR